jgi:hypothetical protein
MLLPKYFRCADLVEKCSFGKLNCDLHIKNKNSLKTKKIAVFCLTLVKTFFQQKSVESVFASLSQETTRCKLNICTVAVGISCVGPLGGKQGF